MNARIALSIALFSAVTVFTAIVALAGVLLKSEHYQFYLAGCTGEEPEVRTRFLRRFVMKPKPVKASVVLYLCLAFGENMVLIFVVALLVSLIHTHA